MFFSFVDTKRKEFSVPEPLHKLETPEYRLLQTIIVKILQLEVNPADLLTPTAVCDRV